MNDATPAELKDMRQRTAEIYNEQAEGLSKKYGSMAPRVHDIELILELAGNPKHARVVEIGCANGRDAAEIVSRVDWYQGIDIAEEFIKRARQHVPQARFEAADAVEFEYPGELDAVIAFASFIHLDKSELRSLYKKLYKALRPGGVIYQSLKYSPEYRHEVFEDTFGPRLYYFYNLDLIQELAGPGFEVVHTRRETREGLNHASWIEIALRKV